MCVQPGHWPSELQLFAHWPVVTLHMAVGGYGHMSYCCSNVVSLGSMEVWGDSITTVAMEISKHWYKEHRITWTKIRHWPMTAATI